MAGDRHARRALRRKRQVVRRRVGLLALVLIALALGLFFGLRGESGNAPASAPAASPAPAKRIGKRARKASPKRLTLPATLPGRTIAVPILMYHRVDTISPTLPEITKRLTVDPADFAAQMRWLQGHGYHTVTQTQLYRALELDGRLPSRPVLISFDDGYRDVFSKAMPVLERLHMEATAYVITGRISGPDTSFLTWGRLKLLERHGIEIGSHTIDHLELPGLSEQGALRQLTQSRRVLERHLGHPVQWFAYPAGAFDNRSVRLVRQAGYVLAVTTRPGARQAARAPLELHRFEVLDSTGVSGLAALLAS